jgi:hypothetical protein
MDCPRMRGDFPVVLWETECFSPVEQQGASRFQDYLAALVSLVPEGVIDPGCLVKKVDQRR